MDDILLAKTASIAIIFCGSLICGLLPAFKVFSAFPRFALSLILSYGGGILIATSIVHILPEANKAWPKSASFTAEMTLCVGIFFVYIIEEIAHFLVCHDIHSPLGHSDIGAEDGHNHGVHVHHDNPPTRCDEPAAAFLFAEERLRPIEHDHDAHGCRILNHHGGGGDDSSHNHTHSKSVAVALIEAETNNDSGCGGDGHHNNHHGNNSSLVDQTTVKLFPESLNESKILPDENNRKSDASKPIVVKLRSLVGLIALSVHAGLEGLSVGLGHDAADVWYLCGAVAAHKLVIAFCLGMEVRIASSKNECSKVKTSSSASFKFRYVLFFALMTPLGIAVGTIITSVVQVPNEKTESPLVAVLQALAAGTLLYVAFFEVILRERARFSGKGLAQLALVILGWATMVIIQIILSHNHSHDHDHCPTNNSDIQNNTNIHDHDHGHD